jgi:hypothetical protein
MKKAPGHEILRFTDGRLAVLPATGKPGQIISPATYRIWFEPWPPAITTKPGLRRSNPSRPGRARKIAPEPNGGT